MDTLNLKNSGQRKILVVDDDSVVGNLISRVLSQAGIENVDVINSAEKALVSLGIPIGSSDTKKDSTYDTIILDVILPDMNGFDLCRRIKSFFPNIPVMLISGYDIREIQTRVIDCGADDFMGKPFNPFELSTRVNLLLNKAVRKQETDTVVDGNFISENMPDIHKIPYVGDKVGNYVILDSIGLGKTSIIYKVIDLKSHEILALKMLTAHSKEFEEIVKRFNYEIDIMSRIDHPNVIKYYNHGVHKKCIYLVMEFLDGVNLEELIISRGRISQQLLVSISIDLASAIAEIHKKGVLHRDIKLKNSIYNPVSGVVKLCDFGIAQLPDAKHITHDGTIVGTPIYMAPESLQGEKATKQSDIFSYGATIYHLATNAPPFIADNHSELYNIHFTGKPTPIESVRSDFSKQWSRLIIDKCLAAFPGERPRDMDFIIKQLKKIKKEIS